MHIPRRLLALPLALCLSMLGTLLCVVMTPSPASATTTCTVSEADAGFGTRRACKYVTEQRSARVEGTATWYYDDGQAANTGNVSGVVVNSKAGKCAWVWLGSEHLGGTWVAKACGQGAEDGYNVALGGRGRPDDGYHYILRVCDEQKMTSCKRVWKQLIGASAPS